MKDPGTETLDSSVVGVGVESWAAEETAMSVDPGAEGGQANSASDVGPGTVIGRYVVLHRLGEGAMGVVLAAYDPRLDRKVALKLLKGRDGDRKSARRRLEREAQALAKLNHPNVVGVHDVGVHHEQVFVAMEHVDGQTVSDWNGSHGHAHDWRKVVEVFEAAGKGLAAAHAGAFVHRDFKPDNIMIGEDGRVRVMDFGLAHIRGDVELDAEGEEAPPNAMATGNLALTRAGMAVGSPAYMAPEQFAGREASAKSDQWSFCVSLFESLFGSRPFHGKDFSELALAITGGELKERLRGERVPPWLWEVVLRGLSLRSADRFADMEELLLALRTGEAQRLRRRLLSGAAAVGLSVAAVFVYQDWELARRQRACVARGAEIDRVWNEATKQGLRSGILGSRATNAATVAEKVMPWIDAQASAWSGATQLACEKSTLSSAWDAALMDRASWCIEERRLELATLIAEMSHPDEGAVQQAVRAAAGLESLAPCTDTLSVVRMPEPPPPEVREEIRDVRETLSKVGYLEAAAKYKEGLELVQEATQRAETLAWPPLLAAATGLESTLLRRNAQYEAAEAAGVKAYRLAADRGDWALASALATELTFCVGYKQARHAEGKLWAEHGEVARKYAGDPGGLREASGLNNLANVHYSKGEYEDAVSRHQRALSLREATLGENHPDVATSLNNMANAFHSQGNFDDAAAMHQRALRIREATLGPEHPDVGTSLNNFANLRYSQGRYDESAKLHERALAIRESARGSRHPDVATSLNNFAEVRRRQGRYDEAGELLRRALDIRSEALGAEHPRVGRTLSNLARVLNRQGQYDEAARMHVRALAIKEKTLGAAHPSLATGLANYAETLALQGEFEKVIETHTRALSIWEKKVGLDHPDASRSWMGQGAAKVALGRRVEGLSDLERALRIRTESDVGAKSLAETRFALARALMQGSRVSSGEQLRARKLAEQAREGYASGDQADAAALARIDAWLIERGGVAGAAAGPG
jgi:tetratricopeptide (TPR) repeat protein/predicted Ser/Thr protein kinase